MNIYIKSFDEFTTNELYEILKLRSEIFVVEQNCVYQDIDDKDRKALHIIGEKDRKIIAYTRIFKAGDYFKHAGMGRIAVKKESRKHGYGHHLVKASIKAVYDVFKEKVIEISAQEYLTEFYETHGFKKIGGIYLEDNIPHVRMLKT